MNLSVDIKMPIHLKGSQVFEFFVGPNMDYVSIHADGTINIRSSGGGGLRCSINAYELVREVRGKINYEQR